MPVNRLIQIGQEPIFVSRKKGKVITSEFAYLERNDQESIRKDSVQTNLSRIKDSVRFLDNHFPREHL